jgi:hypothetical protein
VGHTLHDSEKTGFKKVRFQIPPTSERIDLPLREPLLKTSINDIDEDVYDPNDWGGTDHEPWSPSRQRLAPNRFRDNDCANMVELMLMAKSIEAEHINLDSWGKPLTYKTATSGPNADKWRKALCEELIRLTEETGTIKWDGYWNIKRGDKPTYCSIQVREKVGEDGAIKFRVRLTVGGDKVNYTGDRSSTTASLETLKILQNVRISREMGWCTGDIKDFYLGSPMDEVVYMYINERDVPEEIKLKYHIEFRNGRALVSIHKGMYGLPHAGKLAQDRLILHLLTHGYLQCTRTECLFRHVTDDIAFMVVVDDFGIIHANEIARDNLFRVLRLQYTMTMDLTGSKYLGIDIFHNVKNNTVTLSMPGYVQNALTRFGVTLNPEGTHSPLTYHPVVHGPQVEQVDTSPAISAEKVKRIQQIIGVFLYYARAVDESMLCALNKLASRQTHPSEELETDVNRFLQYAATYPNGKLTFWPSDLKLFVHSDASYCSETGSRSRSGGFFFLGRNDTSGNDQINGGLGSQSKIMPSVLSSTAESEYASLFLNAKRACIFQNILADLGFPQVETEVWVDNNTASSAANKSIRIRRLQSTAMRYHWIQDRIRDGQFKVLWGAGVENLADFFTKIHPVQHHRLVRKAYVHDNNQKANRPVPFNNPSKEPKRTGSI